MHIVGERRIALQLRRSAGHVRLPRYVGAQEERHSIFSVAWRALRARRVAAWHPEGTHGKFDSHFVLLSESVTDLSRGPTHTDTLQAHTVTRRPQPSKAGAARPVRPTKPSGPDPPSELVSRCDFRLVSTRTSEHATSEPTNQKMVALRKLALFCCCRAAPPLLRIALGADVRPPLLAPS